MSVSYILINAPACDSEREQSEEGAIGRRDQARRTAEAHRTRRTVVTDIRKSTLV